MKAKSTERTNRRGVALAIDVFESLDFALREQSESDYGIDCHAELLESERPTGQLLGIQLKSGASWLSERTESSIIFRTDAEHVDYWIEHTLPVIICLCDIDNRVIYWESVSRETAISTGKGYKINIPLVQKVDRSSRGCIKDLLTPLVSSDLYTIFETKDVSHGQAKRYSFRVVINATVSKAQIASIVRQVIREGVRHRYHRNDLVEDKWGNVDAHVVWAFVYLSAEDEARCNHVCRAMWIDENLDTNAHPISIDGENIGEGISVDWNSHYDFIAYYSASKSSTKEVYLNAVTPLLESLKECLKEISENLESLKRESINDSGFLERTRLSRERVSKIYLQIGSLPLAPFECQAFAQCLKCFATCLDNIALHYSEKGLSTWESRTRLFLSMKQLEMAREHVWEIQYELKKIR